MDKIDSSWNSLFVHCYRSEHLMNWFIDMNCLGFFSFLYTNNGMKDSLHVLGYIWQIAAHDDDVNAVAFADDSSHILFSGGDDGLCRVRTEWDQKSVSMGNSVKPYLV